MGSFNVVLQTEASLHASKEPSDFISNHTGIIRYERDRDGKFFKVGKVRAYRIEAGLAFNNGESLFDVCDCHSQEMHFCHTLLYEANGYCFKDPLVERFEAMEMDCLVIDFVLLNPKWRGLKLGLLAVRKMIDLLGRGCGLTVCHIAPLDPDAAEFENVPKTWIPRQNSPEERKEATVKLRGYFRKMGFERIGRSPYYGLSMARKAPNAEELLKPKGANSNVEKD
jgi:hypothetical protein